MPNRSDHNTPGAGCKRIFPGESKSMVPSVPLLPVSAGTYALWFWLTAPLTLSVGRLGQVRLGPGLIVYVGSARGPGGLRARVGRHLRAGGRPHWHIDTLTAQVPVTAVWYTQAAQRLECVWAAQLLTVPGATIPIAHFGSSDCACLAHLLAFPVNALPVAWQRLNRPAVLTLWALPESGDVFPASGRYGHRAAAESRTAP